MFIKYWLTCFSPNFEKLFFLKNEVGRQNTTFKLKDVERLYRDVKGRITKENWRKAEEHVIEKVEKRFWELDNIQSEEVNQRKLILCLFSNFIFQIIFMYVFQ